MVIMVVLRELLVKPVLEILPSHPYLILHLWCLPIGRSSRVLGIKDVDSWFHLLRIHNIENDFCLQKILFRQQWPDTAYIHSRHVASLLQQLLRVQFSVEMQVKEGTLWDEVGNLKKLASRVDTFLICKELPTHIAGVLAGYGFGWQVPKDELTLII